MHNVANSFLKAKNSYFKNAIVQKQMRYELLKHINKSYNSIFEFGSNRGEFSKLISKKTNFKKFVCLDINDFSLDYSDKFIFLKLDMADIKNHKIYNKKFDLITSNACIQWLNFQNTIQDINNMARKNSQILISTFGKDNLFQIRDICGVGLDYLTVEQIDGILRLYFRDIQIWQKRYLLNFNCSLDIFRHLKLSGVTSLGNVFLGKNLLKKYEDKYGCSIQYHAIFINAKK